MVIILHKVGCVIGISRLEGRTSRRKVPFILRVIRRRGVVAPQMCLLQVARPPALVVSMQHFVVVIEIVFHPQLHVEVAHIEVGYVPVHLMLVIQNIRLSSCFLISIDVVVPISVAQRTFRAFVERPFHKTLSHDTLSKSQRKGRGQRLVGLGLILSEGLQRHIFLVVKAHAKSQFHFFTTLRAVRRLVILLVFAMVFRPGRSERLRFIALAEPQLALQGHQLVPVLHGFGLAPHL